jgi:hypothetical protein
MRWTGHGERRNAFRILERKKPLGRLGWGGIDWIDLARVKDRWRATVSIVMNLWLP